MNRPKMVVGPVIAPIIETCQFKLTKERAAQLMIDLGNEKLAVAEAAFQELGYFDPRLAFTAEEIFKDLPQGLRR